MVRKSHSSCLILCLLLVSSAGVTFQCFYWRFCNFYFKHSFFVIPFCRNFNVLLVFVFFICILGTESYSYILIFPFPSDFFFLYSIVFCLNAQLNSRTCFYFRLGHYLFTFWFTHLAFDLFEYLWLHLFVTSDIVEELFNLSFQISCCFSLLFL